MNPAISNFTTSIFATALPPLSSWLVITWLFVSIRVLLLVCNHHYHRHRHHHHHRHQQQQQQFRRSRVPLFYPPPLPLLPPLRSLLPLLMFAAAFCPCCKQVLAVLERLSFILTFGIRLFYQACGSCRRRLPP
jgi:hypothetical protein